MRSRADEERFLRCGVPWWTCVALRDALDDHAGFKLTYLEGTLEPCARRGCTRRPR